MRTRSLLLATALVVGCAGPQYEYVPTQAALREDAPTEIEGHRAAGYDPADGIDGSIKVALFGLTRLRDERVLHARLIVHNASSGLWTVDPIRQEGAFGASERRQPLLAEFEGHEVELAVVLPGETRTADLYYRLPSPATDEAIASFRVDWRVDAPGRLIAARETPFSRRSLAPPAPTPHTPRTPARKIATRAPSKAARSPSTVKHEEPLPDDLPGPGRVDGFGWPSFRD